MAERESLKSLMSTLQFRSPKDACLKDTASLSACCGVGLEVDARALDSGVVGPLPMQVQVLCKQRNNKIGEEMFESS